MGSGVPTQADLLSERAERFAVRVLKFVRTLPREPAIISRLGIVVDEADESEHWLSVLTRSGLASGAELDWLLQESRELRAIFSKSLTTARANHRQQILKS